MSFENQKTKNFLSSDPDAGSVDSGLLIPSATLPPLNHDSQTQVDYKALYENAKALGELYSGLLKASTDAIVVYDTKGHVKFVNKGFTKIFGWTIQEVSGRRVPFVPESEAALTAATINRLYQDGESSVTFDTKRLTKSGESLEVNISASCYRDAHGEIAGMLVILRDVTDRKQVIDALKSSEEKYRLVIEHAKEAILVAQDQIIKFVNPYASQIAEIPLNEIVGKPFINFIHPDDRQKTFENYVERLQGTVNPERYRIRILTASGKIKWGEIYGHSVQWEGRTADLVFITDVTEREHSETALRQSEENYRAIVNSVEDAIFIHDPQTGAVLDVNERFTELYGYVKEQAIGADVSLFSAEGEGIEAEKALKKIRRAALGHPQFFEWRARAKDGRSFWVDVHLRRVTLNGQDRVLALVRDITDRKRTEELLLQSELLKAVAELATGVAHNFNNVLQKILVSSQSALIRLEQGDPSAVRPLLMEIAQNSRNGSETVKRLQSFAQLRSDVTSGTNQIFDLSKAVRDALEMSELLWRTLAVKNGVSISVQADITDELLVSGISNDLFEVTLNLMRNSIDAISNGGRIRVRTFPRDDYAILEVEDDGIGIAPENLSKIFDPFFTTKGLQSTGMGLAGVYGIVTSHGGSISVDSEVDFGSTFTIALPLASVEKDSSRQGQIPNLSESSMRFLVIDDDEMLLSLFKEALISLGQFVKTASSGKTALRILEEEEFDVITCDLGMPQMNGWEVGRRIVSFFKKKQKAKPTLILLTGWGGQTSEREKILESGIDLVIEKPVDIVELIGRASEAVRNRKSNL